MNWAPLWSVIVDSSLWEEPDYVVKVFLTMMALKDSQHIYRGSAFNLKKRAHKTEQEVLDAWKILSSPDKRRLEKQPYEGRRIEAVDGGWLLLNGEKYRELVQIEMKRERDRKSQAAARLKRKLADKAGKSGKVWPKVPPSIVCDGCGLQPCVCEAAEVMP